MGATKIYVQYGGWAGVNVSGQPSQVVEVVIKKVCDTDVAGDSCEVLEGKTFALNLMELGMKYVYISLTATTESTGNLSGSALNRL